MEDIRTPYSGRRVTELFKKPIVEPYVINTTNVALSSSTPINPEICVRKRKEKEGVGGQGWVENNFENSSALCVLVEWKRYLSLTIHSESVVVFLFFVFVRGCKCGIAYA